MQSPRLSDDELSQYLADCPDDAPEIMLALRDVVLSTAPDVAEAIRFHSLCYFKPGHPYGAIGGNVCMIGHRQGVVQLAFIHGASLKDPQRLLRGTGKAKRQVEIRSVAEAHEPGIAALIRKAAALAPILKSQPTTSS